MTEKGRHKESSHPVRSSRSSVAERSRAVPRRRRRFGLAAGWPGGSVWRLRNGVINWLHGGLVVQHSAASFWAGVSSHGVRACRSVSVVVVRCLDGRRSGSASPSRTRTPLVLNVPSAAAVQSRSAALQLSIIVVVLRARWRELS